MIRGAPRVSFAELRGKYAEMLEMRVEHASGNEDATEVRERMARLAARFPGALREIDELELRTIRERIVSLDAATEGDGAVAPWMEAMARFHSLARGALCVKRWLAGRKHVDAATARAFAREASGLTFPREARSWSADLVRVAAPPRGRLMDVVFHRLALELGTSERNARRLVFGSRRSC